MAETQSISRREEETFFFFLNVFGCRCLAEWKGFGSKVLPEADEASVVAGEKNRELSLLLLQVQGRSSVPGTCSRLSD